MISNPFFTYYGGKFRTAPFYPKPIYSTIIEPFAGSAGYSMRYYDRKIILIEKSSILAEMWRFLIKATPEDILKIPEIEYMYDLPSSTPEGARYLVGFCLNNGSTTPCRQLSSGLRKLSGLPGYKISGWSEYRKRIISRQVLLIKHWKIIEGDYTSVPNLEATWFVDPPYNNRVGKRYPCQVSSYEELSDWCRLRFGQVIVCEQEGAMWLPFKSFRSTKAFKNETSKEVVWEK
jgi:hypothetical protein